MRDAGGGSIVNISSLAALGRQQPARLRDLQGRASTGSPSTSPTATASTASAATRCSRADGHADGGGGHRQGDRSIGGGDRPSATQRVPLRGGMGTGWDTAHAACSLHPTTRSSSPGCCCRSMAACRRVWAEPPNAPSETRPRSSADPYPRRMVITGLDPQQLDRLRRDLLDHGGNPVEPFVDESGGWPLRCCTSRARVWVSGSPSSPGTPFLRRAPSPRPDRSCSTWTLAIRLGVPPCPISSTTVASSFARTRPTIGSPTTWSRSSRRTERSKPFSRGYMERDDVERVVVRNVMAGCYSFTAVR